jgi:hypothetical protein
VTAGHRLGILVVLGIPCTWWIPILRGVQGKRKFTGETLAGVTFSCLRCRSVPSTVHTGEESPEVEFPTCGCREHPAATGMRAGWGRRRGKWVRARPDGIRKGTGMQDRAAPGSCGRSGLHMHGRWGDSRDAIEMARMVDSFVDLSNVRRIVNGKSAAGSPSGRAIEAHRRPSRPMPVCGIEGWGGRQEPWIALAPKGRGRCRRWMMSEGRDCR